MKTITQPETQRKHSARPLPKIVLPHGISAQIVGPVIPENLDLEYIAARLRSMHGSILHE